MSGSGGQSGARADEEQPYDTPPRDPTSNDPPSAGRSPDIAASNDLAENNDDSDCRQWPILAIVNHRIDPDDPTRLQFRIKWAEADGSSWEPTWEPESNIQIDAPHLWREYTSRHNCRDALGRNRNKFHMLYIVGHEVIRRGRAKATVMFEVQWEGSTTLSKLSEKAATGRNADLVADYWEGLGGREKAL